MNQKTLIKEIRNLFNEIHEIENNPSSALSLPENTFFLKDGRILCLPRKNGVSRFPYGGDGFTAWVYSSGYISINESTFYLFLPSEEGKEPYMAFFAGEKRKDGKYEKISLLGAARNLEEKDIKRYVVYGKDAAYFLTESHNNLYGVRIYVTNTKKVALSVAAIHKKKAYTSFYLSSFMNGLFKYADRETMETKWFKKCNYENNRFIFESHEDIDRTTHVLNYGVIQRCLCGKETKVYNTTSRSHYAGARENSIAFSPCLLNGKFEEEKLVTHFSDTAAAGDIIHYELANKDFVRQDYFIDFCHDEQTFEYIKNFDNSYFPVDDYLTNLRAKLKRKFSSKNMLSIKFKDWKNTSINTDTLNLFLEWT